MVLVAHLKNSMIPNDLHSGARPKKAGPPTVRARGDASYCKTMESGTSVSQLTHRENGSSTRLPSANERCLAVTP